MLFSCSMIFIVKSLYEVQDSHSAGCGDKGLTYEECNEAINVLGYNIDIYRIVGRDRPKGCVIADPDGDTLYTLSYFSVVTGPASAKFKSICFPGIN